MSIVRPFKAVRPMPAFVEKVASLPYDVMSSDEAREIVKDNPYSFLHVDKAEIDLPLGTDLYDSLVYEKAKENLDILENDGIFIEDSDQFFYIYRLTMDGRSQTGLTACASIDEYINGDIKKHELTREDKERDRIRHVETTNANTGPIFLTYRAKSEIDSLIGDWIEKNEPIYDFVSEDGVGHTVWIINCAEQIEKIKILFASVPALYIADGHHRNASAVKVGLKKRELNPNADKNAEFNFFLSVIFPDNQLYIMDYNRVVKTLNGLTQDEFLKEISASFDVQEYGINPYHPEKRHTFGMYINKKWYKLTAKDEIIDETDTVMALDVSILQENLLTKTLGIGDIRMDKNIDFVGGLRGLSALSSRVDSGEMAVAFAIYPTSMSELMDIADSGRIMPPKSTWFEPKLRSGLFIHKLG